MKLNCGFSPGREGSFLGQYPCFIPSDFDKINPMFYIKRCTQIKTRPINIIFSTTPPSLKCSTKIYPGLPT